MRLLAISKLAADQSNANPGHQASASEATAWVDNPTPLPADRQKRGLS